MVDEYLIPTTRQERMLDLLSRGQKSLYGGRYQAVYLTVSVKRIRRFSVISLRLIKRIAVRQANRPHENFRSHLEVLEATNDVFKRLMDEEVGKLDYNETHYLVAGNPSKREPNPATALPSNLWRLQGEGREAEAACHRQYQLGSGTYQGNYPPAQ